MDSYKFDCRLNVHGRLGRRGMEPLNLVASFVSKVRVAGRSECWLWTGQRDAYGYGRFTSGRRKGFPQQAHQISLLLFKGEAVPSGMHTDHLCRNPSCVNPHHLEVVTPRENAMRGDSGKWRRSETCFRGHPWSPATARWTMGPSGYLVRTCRACSFYRHHGRHPTPSELGEVSTPDEIDPIEIELLEASLIERSVRVREVYPRPRRL